MPRAKVNTKQFTEYSQGIYAADVKDFNLIYDKAEMPTQITEKGQPPDHLFNIPLTIKDHGDREYNFSIYARLTMTSSNQLDPDNPQLARLFSFLDAIDYSGGYNPSGKWENKEGQVISEENIAEDVCAHILKQKPEPLLVCVYPQVNKKDGRTYLSLGWDVFPNTKEGLEAAHKRYDKLLLKTASKPSGSTAPQSKPAGKPVPRI